ncbi:response regulator [Tenacibaculum larymnensis]|uniref:histidine kinase n=1 Tax=Tenacibaculum larymnensis TaxID=2878201 RepID=A0A9X4IMF8_9FLAO|nr:response regulator [Tenacibaculum larymnensis]MDE1207684.1 response regulator [Tenacibaculum larymnensis]
MWSQQLLIPDSLLHKSVEEKIVFLNSEGQKQNAIDSSNIYFNEALKLAKTCDCDSLLMMSHINKAYHLIFNKGKIDLGLEEIQNFDQLIEQTKTPYFKYRVALMKGYSFNLKDQSDDSFNHYNKALEYAEQMQDSFRMGIVYNNLGNNFNSYNDSKAKSYYLKALDLYERHNAPNSEKQLTYLNMARVSSNLDSITYFSKKSYQYLDTTNVKNLVHYNLNKSAAFFSKGFFKEGNLAAKKAYKYAEESNYEIARDQALLALGYTELELGNTKQAIKHLEQAKQSEVIGPLNKKYTFETLIDAYKKNNQLEQALQASQELLAITDSVYQQRKTSTFAEFDAKFNLAEKDKEIALQELEIAKQKNARNKWIFGSIGTLLLSLFIIIWFISKQKHKKNQVQMKLEKEQEINQLRTKFLGNIAHEIRTPLTLVSGNLNLALENLDNTTKAKKNLQVALDNTKKITDDANEILELLKFEGQKMTLNKTTVPLRSSLERIVFSFHSMAQIKAIEISYNSNISKNIFIATDIGKVEKIINNLLSNAIKYAPSNSKIIVSDMFKNNNLTISVTDFGEGINYNEQKRIFERFYQSENASKVGGIGIGLALSKEFAEFLNGSLTVESNLREGSTFTLKVPLQISENAIDKIDRTSKLTPQKEPKSTQSTTNDTILIVEDNPQMANYIKELLEDTYNCDVAFNGEEALNLLKFNNYSLVTSDIMMPKIDGFELREKMNTIDKYKYTPFIFISAKTLEIDKIKGFSLGIADYIVKPFNKNELVARIKNLLKNKASRVKWQLENTDQLSKTESSDQKLLRKIEAYILDNIDNDDFKIKELADYVGYSQRQLARIMKQYTGMSPVKFILEIRLQKAYTLLQNKMYSTLSETRYAVGINSSAYFNKKFKERFGVLPSEV